VPVVPANDQKRLDDYRQLQDLDKEEFDGRPRGESFMPQETGDAVNGEPAQNIEQQIQRRWRPIVGKTT
jgi:hypothetical protein